MEMSIGCKKSIYKSLFPPQIRPPKTARAAFAKATRTGGVGICKFFFFAKAALEIWLISCNYDPLLALAQPFYNQLTSPSDMWCISTILIIYMAFKVSKKPYLRINKSTATWAAKLPAKTKFTYYTVDGLMEDIKVLLDNIYIQHAGKIYRQIIGIPIGSDCSQDLANLFLFSYEQEYVYGLINDGRDDDAEFLSFVYRYIDDLITMNDVGFLDRVYKDIYPSEMVLNKIVHVKPC